MFDDDGGDAETSDDMISSLQTLGVSAIDATRYIKSLHTKEVTFMEAYGRGGLSELAQKQRRNLGVRGLSAMDLRTEKPGGGNWGFSKKKAD